MNKSGRLAGVIRVCCGLWHSVKSLYAKIISITDHEGFDSDDARLFPVIEAWTGVAISHISHLISTLVLYDLAHLLFKDRPDRHRIAFSASCLHIISPAGLFLSAPYGESLFSCLHFIAHYFFAKALSWQKDFLFWRHDIAILLSGLFIALATSVRSNGIASGILFLYEVGIDVLHVLNVGLCIERVRKLMLTVMGGLLVSLGSILPQYVAYQQYCRKDETSELPRQWCHKTPPSIYNFVQTHYW